MDLKTFAQNNQQHEQQPDKNAKVGNMSEADVRRAIKHFGGMSNDQLMRELSKHISAKKRAGKESEIYGIIERIKPMLNADQLARLEEIMGNFN